MCPYLKKKNEIPPQIVKCVGQKIFSDCLCVVKKSGNSPSSVWHRRTAADKKKKSKGPHIDHYARPIAWINYWKFRRLVEKTRTAIWLYKKKLTLDPSVTEEVNNTKTSAKRPNNNSSSAPEEN